MKKVVLLYLEQEPRKVAPAVRAVLKGEEFTPVSATAEAAELGKEKHPAGAVFVVSQEGDWSVVAAHGDEPLDVELASAIAGESGGTGWIVEPVSRDKIAMWAVTDGQRAEEPQPMTQDKSRSYLKTAGVAERLLNFSPRQHLEKESTKLGKHQDVLLGFARVAQKQKSGAQEVKEALAPTKPAKEKSYTLEKFLDLAVKHKGVRAIAKAQIEEQFKRDGFSGVLSIVNPTPEGHFCEAFKAESYSFTSNGPYVWFDWSCEEACEPELAAEKAFPACDLKFSLQKSGEL
ncbi:MAG: hypothetical protein U0517_00800 [Candidatus Andersenbacteria bacterium]